MAGRIPSQFIDDLLTRVNIVDVVNHRVPLKKAGRDYQACCPFHDEKTPSFTVSAEKQFYHCFGCGAHGSAIGFLMEYDNLGFVEAVEDLAGMAGLEVPREAGVSQGPDLRPLYDLLEKSADFYRSRLRKHPQAPQAVQYLKHRGLSGEIAAAFGIGFAPPGWDNLLKHFGTDEQTIGRLRETGLISEPGDKRYDRFRNRIIFPIRDQRGRTIGFGGRVLDDSTPKYLNSPETPLFHKGRELYGLYEAKQALRKIARLLVVEGYMDVVALAQFGIRNAVATLGTATTPEHLELIFRTCPEVVFCFDGDRAGRDAAWKALQTALPVMREGREARFLFLPDGEDPDTLIRKEGSEAFDQRLDQAQPLSNFLLGHLASQVHMDTIDGRARLVELARPLLEKLPPGIFRRMMYRQLEQTVGLQSGTLGNSANPLQPGKRPHASGGEYRKQRPKLISNAIALLLDKPSVAPVAKEVPDDWINWDTPGIPLLHELLEIIYTHPTLNKATLLERWRDRDEYPHLAKIAARRFDFPGMDHEAEFRDVLNRLVDQYRKANTLAPRNAPLSEMSEELSELRQRFPGKIEADDNNE
ncbi:MAG: DNA primase [gamma proteobacterium endosymbiont of Lamellibrachia anaximandri]|nr:DNA primase [gamma proteobacterium endosymbiont of Lamellibrachia anaximandri]MBL3535057.1 DNA primase [gamma proteobacterium endosymbiont of Lamellibrachia anaximandri]